MQCLLRRICDGDDDLRAFCLYRDRKAAVLFCIFTEVAKEIFQYPPELSAIRFDHHHSGEKDRADRRKSNQQTPADRSPWRNASDDRRNCIYYFQEFLEQLSGIRFTCHSGKCQELYARCLPWLRSISADYGDYFLPVGADRTLRLWRQGNKACRYRTGAFLLPVHRCNCSCCRNVLESDSFFSITTDWSCRWSAAVWRSERNPSSIMRSWTRKLYYTENIFLEREICHSQNITGYSTTGLVLYPSHSHSGLRTFIHNKNASPGLHRFWHFYYGFSESFFIILQMLLLFRKCCLHPVRTS